MTGITHSIDDTEKLVEHEITEQRQKFALTYSRYMRAAAPILLVILIGLWLLVSQYTQLIFFAATLIPLIVVVNLYPRFHQTGQWTAGTYALILATLFIPLVIPLLLPELLVVVGLGYLIIIAVGSMFLSEGQRRWLIAGCGVAFCADILLLDIAANWFPPLDETVSTLLTLIDGFMTLIGGGIIVRAIISGQENQFRQARRAQSEIDRLAAAERSHKERLEGTISEYMNFVQQVANGDLSTRLAMNPDTRAINQDIYELGVNLNSMVESLSAMTRQIREAAAAVLNASLEIQAAASQQVASANEQNAAVTQTVTTVEEVETTVAQTAERARTVADSSQASRQVSHQGQSAVSDIIQGMQVIQGRVEDIAETILKLSEHTQQIGEIIGTVSEIADQSKLLALNASIEAARAGEEGRGFAVVALEVRKLAEQSREATARVQTILHEIQQATNTAVMVTEEGSKSASSGMALVERAGQAIQALTATLEEATQAAIQIAASTHQQANGMKQLTAAMTQIRQASVQAAASTQQTEESVSNIITTTHQLEQAANRYKLYSS